MLLVVNIVDLALTNISVADPLHFCAKVMYAGYTIRSYIETIEMNKFSHKYLDKTSRGDISNLIMML